MTSDLFTLKQVAGLMPLSLNTLYRWIQSGRLQVYQATGFIYSWLTTLDNVDLAAQVDERTQTPHAPEQRQANIVAHQLMQELGYVRADEWSEVSP